MPGGRTTPVAAALAAVIALGVLTTGAGAAHQTPKNGCTSFGVPEGHLISPQFGIQVPQTMTFRYWFEIESAAPANDALLVQYSEDGGASWQTAQNPVSYTHLTLPTILLV